MYKYYYIDNYRALTLHKNDNRGKMRGYVDHREHFSPIRVEFVYQSFCQVSAMLHCNKILEEKTTF